ncbi:jg7513 [Pararge aegeria aegeria]|uniref:Jg7513 protein n=1 Tax=Pararge aegeria aegeria TaxID=348720 RepID=A0A8S4RED1_9NEOP|nr:jg7513 [Pararge aegeria aegeria]
MTYPTEPERDQEQDRELNVLFEAQGRVTAYIKPLAGTKSFLLKKSNTIHRPGAGIKPRSPRFAVEYDNQDHRGFVK